MINYSLALIGGYVVAKWVTPRSPSLLTKRFHIHHWMWGASLLCIILALGIENELMIGALTGVVLEGLSYKNWKLKRQITTS